MPFKTLLGASAFLLAIAPCFAQPKSNLNTSPTAVEQKEPMYNFRSDDLHACGVNPMVLKGLKVTVVHPRPKKTSPELPEGAFARNCTELEGEYSDPTVKDSFELAKANPQRFAEVLRSHAAFGTTHSPTWYSTYRYTATELAQRGEWIQVAPMLNEVINRQPERGNDGSMHGPKEHACLLLFAAVANFKTQHYEDALSDLKLLYEFHKNKPEQWIEIGYLMKKM